MTSTSTPNNPATPQSPVAADFFNLGDESLQNGNPQEALKYFSQAVELERKPTYLSTFAFCRAKVTGEFSQAISLCKEAVKHDPKNVAHFLQLGRIHLLEGKKNDAIRIFRLGLRIEKDSALIRELKNLGCRTEPVLPFLARSNPLNIYLGKLLKKHGYR